MKTLLSTLALILACSTISLNSYSQTSWTGATSVNWATASNWTNGVPTATSDVIIGDANFTGSFQPAISASSTAKSLTIGGAIASQLTIASTLTVKGNVNITSNGTVINGSASLSLTGDWINAGSYSTSSGNATIIFAGINQAISGSAITTFRKLTINTGSILSLNTDINCSGAASVLVVNGTLNPNEPAGHLVTADSLVVNSGAVLKVNAANFNSNYQVAKPIILNSGSIVEYSSVITDQVINSNLMYSTLRISGDGKIKSLSADLPLLRSTSSSAGYIYVLSGTLDLKGYAANRGTTVAGGIISVSNGAFLKIGGTNSFPTGYATVTLPISSTVEYNGVNQVVQARTYGNLTLSSASGAATKTFPATAFTVSGSLSSNVGSGTSVSFAAAANLTVNGSFNIGAFTTFDGGSFIHYISGNWNNNGTFISNASTIYLKGANTFIAGNSTQNFYNLTIYGVNITAPSITSLNISGNFTTVSSGTFTHPAPGTLSMTGNTKTMAGLNISLNNLNITGIITSTATVSIGGDFNVSNSLITTNGTITLSGSGKSLVNSGTCNIKTLKTTGSISTASNFTISGTLTNTGTLLATAGIVTFSTSTILNGTVNLADVTITGSYLRLAANSVLGISGNLTQVGSAYLRTTSYTPNTVNYNGTGAQIVRKTTYNNLVLSNGNTKTAEDVLTINNTFTIAASTTFDASTFIHTLNGNWVNNGNFVAGTSTIQFRGATNTTISGATTFNTLKLYKSASTNTVTLLQDVTAATVDMYRGTLKTGSKILTITNNRINSGIILGTITRTHAFVAGTAYAFEGANSTIKFGTVSGVTSVTVNTTIGNVADFPYGGAIGRVYTITIPTGTYTNATLRLHYEDAELNGNDESKMQLWRYNGAAWALGGKTSNSTTSNYVEKTGLTDISNRWTFTDDGSKLAWNGSLNSDWSNAGNWTLIQGTFSGAPGATDIVQIGNLPFTNQPVISTAVKVKGITFGSTQNAVLSLASGGSLIVDGTMQGTWSANASHLLQANNNPVTMNGDLLLSDGVNGHNINVDMGTGTLTVNGSILQSGNASISFTGSGSLKIGQDYNYINGNFNCGSSTVSYIGSGSQTVAGLSYYHLTIAKPAGTNAIISDYTKLAGNLTVSSGELDVYDTLTIAGSLSVTGTAFLEADSSYITLAGTWSQATATSYDAGSGTVLLNGSGPQTISVAAFNILNINKPTGTVSLSDNISINEDLNLLAGTLNLSAYTINDAGAGDVFSMADGTNLYVSGANNFPENFNTYTLGTNSNVYYDGIVAQNIAEVDYGNLILSNGGASAKTFTGSPAVNGDLTINSGTTIKGSNSIITLNGNWVNNGGNFIPETSGLLLNGNTKTLTGNSTFNDFTVNGSYSVASSDMTFNGEFLVTNSGSYKAGTGVATVNGDFTNSGYAFSPGTTTFSGTTHQDIRLINALVSTSTGIVNFNGNVSPDFNSTTTPTFATLNINNTAGVNPSVGWTVLIAFNINSGAIFNGGNSTHLIEGSFTNNGTVTSTGTLDFEPYAAVPIKLNGTNFSSTGEVIFGGSANTTITGTPNQLNDVIIANTNSAGITPPSGWNLDGDFIIKNGSVFNAGAYSYVVAGDIESDGTLNGNTSTFTMTSPDGQLTGSPETLFNNFTITGNISANSDYNVGGDFTNNGTYDGSLGALIMSGNKNAFINGTTIPSSISQLTVSKDSGVIVTANIDINNVSALIVNSGTFFTSTNTISQDGGGGALVVLDGATLKIGGTNTLPAFSGYGLDVQSTVDYAGTAQTIAQAGSGYGNLLISTPGNKTAVSFVPLTIAGNFILKDGNFIANNNTHKLEGDWIMTGGTFTNTNSTILFNGTDDQKIQTIAPFNNVTLNKIFGSLSISNDITINKTLTFAKGTIRTGSNKVIIASSGNISGAGPTKGWVFGNLQKNIPVGSSVSQLFEIGDSLNYTYANILFSNVTTAGNVIAGVTPTDQPQSYYSAIDPGKSVNRYWTVKNAGAAFTSADLTFNWIAADVDAGANTANFKAATFDGSNWITNTVTSPLATSIKATGCNTFGDFQIGELLTQFKWTGNAMTTDWNTKENWLGGIPTLGMNTLIPAGISGGRSYPVISSTTATVKDLTIENSAGLQVNGAKLQISGAINNSGTFNATFGTLEMNGSTAQSISGSMFQDKTIQNLIVSNTGSGLSVSSTANDTLKITGALTFGTPTSALNTGDNITLVSNISGTAMIGKVATGNTITGKVIVEKYINCGTLSGQHGKSWQFLSAPTNGQTVKESWMESGNPVNGYGTMMSGAGGTAAGYDVTTATPSLKYYNDATNGWTGVPNTGNTISNPLGYMVFVRGDRTITTLTQQPVPTVMRTKGNLFTGTLLPITVTGNKFQSIGNPYASPIDFSLITKDASIDDAFYIFDPYLYGSYGLGGYQSLSSVNNWKPVPGGTLDYPASVLSPIIQSGQAFFVHSHSATSGTVTFTEDCKSSTSRPIVSRNASDLGGTRQFLRATLLTGKGVVADGNVMAYDKSFRNNIDGQDMIKIANSGENFSVKSQGNLLAIEAKNMLSANDTIYYNMSNLSKTNYQLVFAPENLETAAMQAYLVDKYLQTETPVSLTDTTIVPVTVNTNAASSAADRFKIVFRQMGPLPVTITSVTAVSKDKSNLVQWTVANETGIREYETEKSSDGNQFTQIGVTAAINQPKGSYSITDNNVSGIINYYRIRIISIDGKASYSQVVKVVNGKQPGSFSVYPNPITEDIIHLQMNNQPAGKYQVRLYNAAGQVLLSKEINHAEGSSKEDIKCENLPKGVYQLKIGNSSDSSTIIRVIK